jgi:hypothetical protein
MRKEERMEENGKNEPIFVDMAGFLVEVSFTLGFLVRVILTRPETVCPLK